MPGVRFSAEQRAVRLVAESTQQHGSEWAAIQSVAAKIGASAECASGVAGERDVVDRPHGTSRGHGSGARCFAAESARAPERQRQ